jgi:hypothetical protein
VMVNYNQRKRVRKIVEPSQAEDSIAEKAQINRVWVSGLGKIIPKNAPDLLLNGQAIANSPPQSHRPK